MTLLIHWDGEIDGPFRRRLERALEELQIGYADAAGVDIDPEARPPVRLAVLAAAGHGATPDADLVALGGPGEFREAAGALRLETSDIGNRTRRWIAFAEKLGPKLGRPALAKFAASGATIEEQRAISLAFPSDPLSKDFAPNHSPEVLMERLAAMTSRAEAAEHAASDLERERSDALRQVKQADAQAAVERARVANLEQTLQRLTALSEATTFALAYIPAELHATVSSARDRAWRARLSAARAAEMADAHPEALVWPKARASYSGETRNRLPHGFGRIVFSEASGERAFYAGAFEDGQRSGHGIATSDGGHVWCGQWRDGEACGFGLLEAPDGSRFEGEVAPDEHGAPRQVRGWTWNAAPMTSRHAEAHRPVPPALPSPQAAGG
jgi:hypothetical protein